MDLIIQWEETGNQQITNEYTIHGMSDGDKCCGKNFRRMEEGGRSQLWEQDEGYPGKVLLKKMIFEQMQEGATWNPQQREQQGAGVECAEQRLGGGNRSHTACQAVVWILAFSFDELGSCSYV